MLSFKMNQFRRKTMTAYKVNIGDPLPTFRITDNDGYELTNNDLSGSPVVLYFYPKDDTPGCTAEACSYRDNMEMFDNLDTLVIGISPDNASSHEKFTTKHELNYTLLSDENQILSRAFDVIRDGNKFERTTFVIDSNGIIQWIERPVNITGHVERVIHAIQNLADSDMLLT